MDYGAKMPRMKPTSNACTYDVIVYSSSGESYSAVRFNVEENATDEKIINSAKTALSSSSLRALPMENLTMQIDRYNRFVHIRDKINANYLAPHSNALIRK